MSRLRPRDITLLCLNCREPVRGKEGYVRLEDNKALEVGRQRAEWEAQRRNESSWKPIDMGELMDLPDEVPWLVYHRRCDPKPEAESDWDYWFWAERCSTYDELLDWIAHLSEKAWFAHTNLAEFLRRVVQDTRQQREGAKETALQL